MLGLGSLRASLGGILRPATMPVASSSRVTLPPTTVAQQVRFKGNLSPRRVKHRKAMKGRVDVSGKHASTAQLCEREGGVAELVWQSANLLAPAPP